MRIYVASSWRNDLQPLVVNALRMAGHEVYDFKNPSPGNHGFHWSEVDPNYKEWDTNAFAQALEHPLAKEGYSNDMSALMVCDACVLVLPSGRSAHLELGYAIGAGKFTLIVGDVDIPELMYKAADGICSLATAIDVLQAHDRELKARVEPVEGMIPVRFLDDNNPVLSSPTDIELIQAGDDVKRAFPAYMGAQL